MIISLLGYMGSGKTTVGKGLSDILNLNFIDLDDYITQHEKKSIKQIFSEYGEIYFRKRENYYLNEVLNQDNIIVSLGGGTPVYHNNMELINDKSLSFYLKMLPSELAERLSKEKEHRPVISHLNNESLEEFIAKHLFERSDFYEKANHKIHVNKKTIEDICKEIKNITQSECK